METGGAAGWTDFLIATAGSAGALAGLVFVALSINLGRIIQLPGQSGRAGETICLLATTLVCSLVALIPGQGPTRLGLVLLVVWLPTWGVPTVFQLNHFRSGHCPRLLYAVVRLMLFQIATVPLLLAGLSLRGHLAGGLAWFALAVVLSMIVALINAWILLVEILR